MTFKKVWAMHWNEMKMNSLNAEKSNNMNVFTNRRTLESTLYTAASSYSAGECTVIDSHEILNE